MKTLFTIILILLFISSICIAQDTLYIYKGGEVVGMRAVADIDSITFNKSGSSVSDIEGNVYKTVKIGTQTWMAENLKTRKYTDGTAIPLVTDDAEWTSLETPGYCWYNNDSTTYNATYGVYYNWYAVNTASNNSKNVCPTGWHVPNNAEWTVLTDYLGGVDVAGGKLKEAGFAHWLDPNTGANNEIGFTALPGGFRFVYGQFLKVGEYGSWWSSSEFSADDSWTWRMYYNFSYVYSYSCVKKYGFSVRCVRD